MVLMRLLRGRKPFKENPKLTGILTIRHKKADGTVIKELTKKNVITNTGLAEVAGLINGATSGAFDRLAIGTGTTAAAAGDTALESEITTGGGARAQDSSPTRSTTTQTNDTAEVNYEWTFTASFSVTEAGVLDAAAAGVLLCRQTFSAIAVVNTDKLEITWKIVVS